MNSVILINKRYSLGLQIGSGSFGDIYLGFDTYDNTNKMVAIKLEKLTPKPKYELLEFESRIYDLLTSVEDKYNGIPKIYWKGVQDDFYVLVMEYLGPNLDRLLQLSKNKVTYKNKPVNVFSLKTTLLIAHDFMHIINYIHSKGIIHRDIKPENFLIGIKNNRVYAIDFGLSKAYRTKNNAHIPFKKTSRVIGTIRYCSINCHKGYELSRRDDLESIGYILIYFLKGFLPWQRLNCPADKVGSSVLEHKEKITNEELCSGIPTEFKLYMDHVKGLEFDDKPNYNYLLSLFTNLYKKMNYEYDDVYDW